MPQMVEESFSVQNLSSKESILAYKKSLAKINCKSPYYCYELIANGQTYKQQLHFAVYDLDGVIIAVMPFILREIVINGKLTEYYDVSSPWGYNGPYFNQAATTENQIKFWEYLDSWYRENKVVSEFLRFNFLENYSAYTGNTIHTLYNVKGNIEDWDLFWTNQKPNTRNQFRKAEKLNLKFELHFDGVSKEKVNDFYKVYIGTMDRRDAVNSFYHSLDYFLGICDENPKKCAIGLVYENEIPISSEFFLVSDTTIYSFLGGTESSHFKKRPNEYLKINAIKWASENGLSYYMIGGGLSNSKEDNLYLYKKKYFPNDPDIDFYTGRKIVDLKVYEALMAQTGKSFDKESLSEQLKTGFFPAYREKK